MQTSLQRVRQRQISSSRTYVSVSFMPLFAGKQLFGISRHSGIPLLAFVHGQLANKGDLNHARRAKSTRSSKRACTVCCGDSNFIHIQRNRINGFESGFGTRYLVYNQPIAVTANRPCEKESQPMPTSHRFRYHTCKDAGAAGV